MSPLSLSPPSLVARAQQKERETHLICQECYWLSLSDIRVVIETEVTRSHKIIVTKSSKPGWGGACLHCLYVCSDTDIRSWEVWRMWRQNASHCTNNVQEKTFLSGSQENDSWVETQEKKNIRVQVIRDWVENELIHIKTNEQKYS